MSVGRLLCKTLGWSCIVIAMTRPLLLGLSVLAWAFPLAAAETYEQAEQREIERPQGDEEELFEEELPQAPSAGGLVAPDGDLNDPGSTSEIERELEHADRADSGRGLEFLWLSGDVGVLVLDLTPFSRGAIFPGASESEVGVTYGGAVGVRLLYFTLGVRARGASLNAFSVWSVLGELGIRFPIGRFEPFARAGFGYLGTGTIDAEGAQASAGGFATRLSAGADYYFSDAFSLGIELSLDAASLSRSALDPSDLASGAASPYASSNSALALGFSPVLNVGFHF